MRSLREELTWAARESRRASKEVGAEAREQARQARDEARDEARQARDEALEQARRARDEGRAGSRLVTGHGAGPAGHRDAEVSSRAPEQAQTQPGREDPWEQATDGRDPSQAEAAAAGGRGGRDGGAVRRRRRRVPGQDAARRLREEAAARFRYESAEAGVGIPGRAPRGGRAPGISGEQDWTQPAELDPMARAAGLGRLVPAARRRGWAGPLDLETLRTWNELAVQFTSDLRQLVGVTVPART